MASITTTFADTLNLSRSNIPTKEEDYKAAQACQIALNFLWNSYDWRESMKVFPSFWLCPNVQDYGSPAAIIPSDFQGLREAWIIRTTATPPQNFQLFVNKDIRTTHVQGIPAQIGYEPSKNIIRTFPRTPSNASSPEWMVVGTYKTLPPKVTAATLQTAYWPFDDQYLPVFIACLKWGANLITGTPPDKMFALAKEAQDMVNYMAHNEAIELGDPQIAPAEPLVSGLLNVATPGLLLGGVL